MIVELYAVGRANPAPADPTQGWFAMLPAGYRLINAMMAPTPQGLILSVAALAVPNAPRIKVPFFVCTFRQDIQPLIGRRIGPYVGHCHDPEGIIMLFMDMPALPPNELATAEAQGHG